MDRQHIANIELIFGHFSLERSVWRPSSVSIRQSNGEFLS